MVSAACSKSKALAAADTIGINSEGFVVLALKDCVSKDWSWDEDCGAFETDESDVIWGWDVGDVLSCPALGELLNCWNDDVAVCESRI